MKPKTYNLIAALSQEYEDPNMVKRLIYEYVNANFDHIIATNVKNMIRQHSRAKIALREVHDTSKNMTAKLRPSQIQLKARLKIESSIMEMKLNDAIRCEKKAKNRFEKCKHKMSKFVRKGTLVRNILMEHIKKESEFLWKTETDRARNKFIRNKERQRKTDKKVTKIDCY